MPWGSTSSSRAWNRAALSGSACRSIPPGPQSPHSGASDQPLHALLLLRPGRVPGADRHSHGLVLSFQATCYLNGHSFMEQELKRNNIAFRKDDNAFLAEIGRASC